MRTINLWLLNFWFGFQDALYKLDGYEPKQWLYISNILSLIRIPLTPIAIYYFDQGETTIWITLALLVGLSDRLDGDFARWLNQTTELGKILDPLADKVCSAVAVIGLVIIGEVPVWLVLVVIGRDLLISRQAIKIAQHSIGKIKIIPSTMPGKIAMTVIFTGFILHLTPLSWLDYVGQVSIVIVTVYSLRAYYKRSKELSIS